MANGSADLERALSSGRPGFRHDGSLLAIDVDHSEPHQLHSRFLDKFTDYDPQHTPIGQGPEHETTVIEAVDWVEVLYLASAVATIIMLLSAISTWTARRLIQRRTCRRQEFAGKVAEQLAAELRPELVVLAKLMADSKNH